MIRVCQFTIFILLISLMACGPANPESAEDAGEQGPAENVIEDLPTAETDNQLRISPSLTPGAAESEAQPQTPVEEAYPVSTPVPTPFPENYPAPPPVSTLPPGYDTEPGAGESVWILYPVGEQCAEADDSRYQDETTAVAALTAAGITVFESEIIELLVCTACGCPTSAHYRVSIDSAQLDTALSLEWTLEE